MTSCLEEVLSKDQIVIVITGRNWKSRLKSDTLYIHSQKAMIIVVILIAIYDDNHYSSKLFWEVQHVVHKAI